MCTCYTVFRRQVQTFAVHLLVSFRWINAVTNMEEHHQLLKYWKVLFEWKISLFSGRFDRNTSKVMIFTEIMWAWKRKSKGKGKRGFKGNTGKRYTKIIWLDTFCWRTDYQCSNTCTLLVWYCHQEIVTFKINSFFKNMSER